MAYAMEYPLASYATESARAAFIRRTYTHLAGAILAFVAIEYVLFNFASQFETALFDWFVRSPYSSLVLMIGFIGVGWLARSWARSNTSSSLQYAGLALYVIAEAIIFVPLLHLAVYMSHDPSVIPTAGILTLCLAGGLTAAAFVTRKDFSFLGPILSIGSFVLLGIVLCAILVPGSLQLGMWFSLLAIAIACGAILYDTSNVIHHFRTDQHVAASLSLFASIAFLFYYIMLLLMQRR